MIELRGAAALSQLGPRLDALLADVEAPLTCRRPWLQAWVDAYRDAEPWVLAVESPDGSLAAVAALAVRRRGPLVRVTALGDGPSDETRLPARNAAAAEELAAGVAAGLRALRRPWDLRVEQLPPQCAVANALAQRLPLAVREDGDGLPRVDLDPGGDWRRHSSKNARQSERTARNKLAALGVGVDERWTTDPDEIERALPALLEVHRARDLALGRRPDHDDPRALAFYTSVVRVHARAGQVELLQLLLDGQLAAYTLGFRDGRSFAVWDARLSPDAAQFSAGRLANATALRQVMADSAYDVLDWMRGEEPYKLQSATRVDGTQRLRAWSSPAARLPDRVWTTVKDARRTSRVAARLAAAIGRPAPRETLRG